MRLRNIFLCLITCFSSAQSVQALNPEINLTPLIRNLSQLKDWRLLGQYTSDMLQLWERPGVAWLPAGKLQSAQLAKPVQLVPESSSIDLVERILVPLFEKKDLSPSALAIGPIIWIKDKKAYQRPSGQCSKPAEWEGKWFVYPGDYLFERCQERSDQAVCQKAKQATFTLIYHHKNQPIHAPKNTKVVDPFGQPIEKLFDPHSGENYYWGLSLINGVWKIVSLGVDVDCNG